MPPELAARGPSADVSTLAVSLAKCSAFNDALNARDPPDFGVRATSSGPAPDKNALSASLDGSNALDNGGENLTLYRPPGRAYALADRVNYGNASPWPRAAAGLGASLGRVDGLAYGNDPRNWSAESPGGSPARRNFDFGAAPVATAAGASAIAPAAPPPPLPGDINGDGRINALDAAAARAARMRELLTSGTSGSVLGL